MLAAAFPDHGIHFVGVALAFGLTVLTMAYAVGHVSGAHFNPAVTVGLWVGGRFDARDVGPCNLAPVVGGIAGAAILYVIANGQAGFDMAGGFASNGYGDHSPGHYSLIACLVTEVVMTFGFLFVILGSTHGSAPKGPAGRAIGRRVAGARVRPHPVVHGYRRRGLPQFEIRALDDPRLTLSDPICLAEGRGTVRWRAGGLPRRPI